MIYFSDFSVAGGGSPALWDTETITIFPASSVSIDSAGASYTTVTDGPGGDDIAVTIDKGDNTDILIIAELSVNGSTTFQTMTLAVSDGTTTYDIAATRHSFPSSNQGKISGSIQISGLPAGTYTYTMKYMENGASSTFSTDGAASMTAMEVA